VRFHRRSGRTEFWASISVAIPTTTVNHLVPLAKAGIRDFVQYRARGYAAKRLQKRGVPLQVIMQVGGWKREAMPTRYIGKYDEGELQAFPTADLR
jgi:hypothetical protein